MLSNLLVKTDYTVKFISKNGYFQILLIEMDDTFKFY